MVQLHRAPPVKALKHPVPGTIMHLKFAHKHIFTERGDNKHGLAGDHIIITNNEQLLVMYAEKLCDDRFGNVIDYKVQVLTKFGVYWTWYRDCLELT